MSLDYIVLERIETLLKQILAELKFMNAPRTSGLNARAQYAKDVRKRGTQWKDDRG